eukprot:9582974-Alexandrium_andersonii.AAC.1
MPTAAWSPMGRPQKKTTQRVSSCRPSRAMRKRSPLESREPPSAARARAGKVSRTPPGSFLTASASSGGPTRFARPRSRPTAQVW